ERNSRYAERGRFETDKAKGFGPCARYRKQRRLAQRTPLVVSSQPPGRRAPHAELRRSLLPGGTPGPVADEEQANRTVKLRRRLCDRLDQKAAAFEISHSSDEGHAVLRRLGATRRVDS